MPVLFLLQTGKKKKEKRKNKEKGTMEPVIKSKEKCLHCIFGVTGECDMYDDFGLPEDGEKCYNYEEASEEETAEGQRIAEGEDIKIEDCIGFLKAQSEDHNIDSPKRTLYNKSVEYLNKLQEPHADAQTPDTANSRLLDEDTYKAFRRLGILDTSVRSYNRGASDYSRHIIQPWTIWQDYNLNPWDADIIKRVLRHKATDTRKMDYEKIIHICEERIRQIDTED